MNANELDAFLKRTGMTGNELAARLNVHYVTISRWRNGREPITKTVELALKWLEAEERRNKRANLANELEHYNKWRRGAEDTEQPNPTKLGILIDEIVKELRR